MESISDPSNGLRVVVACYTGAYSPPHHFLVGWLSKTPSILSYDIQSRPFSAQRSEPPCPLDCDIQSRLSRFDVHSYQFSLATKAVVLAWHSWLLFLVWFSESFFLFGVQSHCMPQFDIVTFFVLTFRAIVHFPFSVQSHTFISDIQRHILFGVQSRVFSLAFRAIVHFHFGVQSHCLFFIWRLEPHPRLGVQTHIFILALRVAFSFRYQSHHLFHLAFRFVIHFPFGAQSHVFDLAFRATSSSWRSEPHFHFNIKAITFFIWHSESLFIFRLAFRAFIHFPFGIQSRILILAFKATSSVWRSEPHFHFDIKAITFFVWRSEPLSIFRLAFKATFSFRHLDPCFLFEVQSHTFILVFRATFVFLVRRSEPHLQFNVQSRIVILAFKAISLQFGIQSLCLSLV